MHLFPKDFLERHGTDFAPWTLEDSLAYTRWLSGAHYENFHVVSFLLPKRLRNWILLTAIVHFALIFPEPLPQLRRRPWAFALLYLLFLPLFLFNSTFWIALAYGIERWFDPRWAGASGAVG